MPTEVERARDRYLLKLRKVLDVIADVTEVSHVQMELPLRCSFCHKGCGIVKVLVSSNIAGLHICDECISACSKIVNEVNGGDT